MELPGRERSLTIYSVVWIQFTEFWGRWAQPPSWDGGVQTDGQMDTGRQKRPRLRIASRGERSHKQPIDQHRFQ